MESAQRIRVVAGNCGDPPPRPGGIRALCFGGPIGGGGGHWQQTRRVPDARIVPSTAAIILATESVLKPPMGRLKADAPLITHAATRVEKRKANAIKSHI